MCCLLRAGFQEAVSVSVSRGWGKGTGQHWPWPKAAGTRAQGLSRTARNRQEAAAMWPAGPQRAGGRAGSPSTTFTAPKRLAGMAIPKFTLQTTTSKEQDSLGSPHHPRGGCHLFPPVMGHQGGTTRLLQGDHMRNALPGLHSFLLAPH